MLGFDEMERIGLILDLRNDRDRSRLHHRRPLMKGSSISVVRDLDLAPPQVEEGRPVVVIDEDLGMQRIDHEPSILLILHKTSRTQDTEMMRNVHDLDV